MQIYEINANAFFSKALLKNFVILHTINNDIFSDLKNTKP